MRHDLLNLEVFMAVAEHENLTQAARACGFAPSAVSTRIAELEAQVGTSLFERFARGMKLTAAGHALKRHVLELKLALQRMDQEMSEFATGFHGHIRLQAMPSVLPHSLSVDIASYLETHPDIKFTADEAEGEKIIRAVARGRIEVGFVAEHISRSGLESKLYRQEELVVAVPHQHPLANREKVRFEQALAYEFVGGDESCAVRQLLLTQARQLGLPLRQRISVNSFDAMGPMVSSGFGICVLPREIARPLLQTDGFRVLALTDTWASRRIMVVAKRFNALTPTARGFLAHLSTEAS